MRVLRLARQGRTRAETRLGAAALAAVLWLAQASAQSGPIEVGIEQSSMIELDGNPSTGFTWALDDGASENPQLVKVEDLGYAKRELAPGQRPVLGAPSKYQFRVTGVEAGSVKLVFNYGRGREAPPTKTQEVSVEVTGE
jgi:predicted secreted protein